MSGDALTRCHSWPFSVKASESCVRGRTRLSPARAKVQLGHPQFHCGKPPPAEDPKTRIRTRRALAPVVDRDPGVYKPKVDATRAGALTFVVAILVARPLLAQVAARPLSGQVTVAEPLAPIDAPRPEGAPADEVQVVVQAVIASIGRAGSA